MLSPSRPDRRRRLTLIALIVGILGAASISYASPPWGMAPPTDPVCDISAKAVGSGRTFYVDPQRGTVDGDGSKARPWRSLQAAIDKRLIGTYVWEVGRLQKIDAKVRDVKPEPRLYRNFDAVVGDSDTILLASGDHGSLVIRGLVNRERITIMAAPGADVRFSSLNLEGASHFTFRGIKIGSAERPRVGRYLVNMRTVANPRRSDNITFDSVDVGGTVSIADATPEAWATNSSAGMQLFGDCIEVTRSKVHDVHNGIVLHTTRRSGITDSEVRDFSVDGINFSGQDIVVRNNVIRNHWPTGDDRHPDCMQGLPAGGASGPIVIERNVCLADSAGSPGRSRKLQGINFFNGRWSAITIKCNLVQVNMPHGIALYSVDRATVSGNIIVGDTAPAPTWIAAMPTADGRKPVANVIAGNLATGYINALGDNAAEPEALAKRLKISPTGAMFAPARGLAAENVRLEGNRWVQTSDAGSFTDPRFVAVARPDLLAPMTVTQARAALAAQPGCAG